MNNQTPLRLMVTAKYRPPFYTTSRLLARAYCDLMPAGTTPTMQVLEGGVDQPPPRSQKFSQLRALRRTCQEWRNLAQSETKFTEWYYTFHPEGTSGGIHLATIRKELGFLREALLEEVNAESRALVSVDVVPSPET